MASPFYRSTLFRLIGQQARRLRSSAGQGYRWAKLSALWSLQCTAAIAVGCWQWGRQRWQQLQGAVRKGTRIEPVAAAEQPLQPGTAPATDAPIVQVLAWIRDRSPGDGCTGEALSAATKPPQVQGIATDLPTGQLIWITSTHRVNLSSAEQVTLQTRINEALADYDEQLALAKDMARPRRAWILSWLWQAITYFFGGHPQTVCLGHGDISQSQLPAPTDALTEGHPGSLQQQTSFKPREVLRWIQMAIAGFFEQRERRFGGGEPQTGQLSGQSTLALTLLPGLMTGGPLAATWIRQTLSQRIARPGTVRPRGLAVIKVSQRSLSTIGPPASSRLSFKADQHSEALAAPVAVPPADIATAVSTSSYVEVPAIDLGAAPSFLGWLLVALDRACLVIEQGLSRLWHSLKRIFNRLAMHLKDR